MRKEYDTIVHEVREAISLIEPANPDNDYMSAVNGNHNNTITIPKDLVLNAPLTAFSNYKVRDALIATAMKDEQFAFVLVNKIAGSVYKNADEVSSVEMEALAVVANVTCLWEQFNHALVTLKAIAEINEERPEIEIPELAKLTVMLMEKHEVFPFALTREGTSKLFESIEKDLDTNSEGE
jgi:hypothetical protein